MIVIWKGANCGVYFGLIYFNKFEYITIIQLQYILPIKIFFSYNQFKFKLLIAERYIYIIYIIAVNGFFCD